MKLSENALNVLKNFASINSGVVLNKGNVLRTISPEKSILVEATVEDDLPVPFVIYDLNQFLGNVTTLKNPELTFTKDHVTAEMRQAVIESNKRREPTKAMKERKAFLG